MATDKYNFDALAQRIKFLSYCEMVKQATLAHSSIPRPRSEAAGIFKARIADLLFFLNTGALPDSIYSDVQLYREIAESLVKRGDFKRDVLRLFKERKQ